MEVVEAEVVIVGAGPAGLAVGACLRQAGIEFLILEQADRIGATWHRHYDRLHLHTDKRRSELPYLSYPNHYPRYPSRDQLIAYLEGYAEHFDIQPTLNQRVTRASRQGNEWTVETTDTTYRSRFVVVATGYNGEPNIPTWPGQEKFHGPILHSSEYRAGQSFTGQNVLVVGLGNSGGEIAIDLAEHGANPTLAVRGTVNIVPREVLGMPILALAIPLSKLPVRLADALSEPIIRWEFGDFGRYGLRRRSIGPFAQMERYQRIPLIDVGTIDLVRQDRIRVRPGLRGFTESAVEFEDGTRERYDAVILATGYRPRVDRFMNGAESAYDSEGRPLTSGVAAEPAGLYFCGFYVSPTGMLREISLEARNIAADLHRKASRSPEAGPVR